jgi:hypothetical protein
MRSWWIGASALLISTLFIGISAGAIQDNATQPDGAKWIGQLKSTPMVTMEAGLPDQSFGSWLTAHTKGAEVKYQIEACDGSAPVEALPAGSFACVTVTAIRGMESEAVMRFLVATDQGAQGQYSCKFVIGQEGPPPGSMAKHPTRVYRKLSEMTALMEAH